MRERERESVLEKKEKIGGKARENIVAAVFVDFMVSEPASTFPSIPTLPLRGGEGRGWRVRYRDKTAALAIRTLGVNFTSVTCKPYGLWLMPVLRLSFLISKVEGIIPTPLVLRGPKKAATNAAPPPTCVALVK